ncbi:MFS transporter [Streptomyces sp. bgisy022]|uniref:MFS transporter n=1 Tax=Streptomyces sp. bgisy022 TaxID=3413769 RepID=UPI003D716680
MSESTSASSVSSAVPVASAATATAATEGTPRLRSDPEAPDTNRWKALVFIALAQLMVVLDATIVNIALPSAQQDLGISDGNRQWVVTAYALAFGGLLLFGGRIADLWGRKRAFVLGLGGFAAASALGGAATNEAMMFGARALQGVFGALLAPAALSLLAVMFTDGKERAKAFGIYGAIAGGGGAVGLILGGFLTEYLDWRWTFFVNIPFAVIAAAGAYLVIREPAGGRNRSPLDIPGVALSTLGLVALVYGFTRAESNGWSDGVTVGMFVASAVLLLAFVLVESRVRAPLLPLRVVTERNRGGVYLSLGLAIIAMFGLFLFLTYYLQVVKGYSPVRTGFAFLPMIAGMVTGSTQIGARLMTRVAPRLLMGPGFLVAAVGMLLLTRLEIGSSYAALLLPAMLLLGLGMGTAFMPAMSLATLGVEPRDSGVASAMVNTSQQVGGAIGTALLNTIAASATTAYVADRIGGAGSRAEQQLIQLQGQVEGYTSAIWFAVGILVAAAAIATVLVNAGRPGGTAAAASSSVPSSSTASSAAASSSGSGEGASVRAGATGGDEAGAQASVPAVTH